MTTKGDLFDRVRLAREGAAVERCHVHPHVGRYSVGHHSLDMVTLITIAWQAAHEGVFPSAALLVSAAFHDVPERITGDVPSPVKDLLGGALDGVDAKVLDWLGVSCALTSEEELWLRACDQVELYLWSLEQLFHHGNTSFAIWVGDYDEYFRGNPPPWPLQEIMSFAKNTQMRRLPQSQLKEIAEL